MENFIFKANHYFLSVKQLNLNYNFSEKTVQESVRRKGKRHSDPTYLKVTFPNHPTTPVSPTAFLAFTCSPGYEGRYPLPDNFEVRSKTKFIQPILHDLTTMIMSVVTSNIIIQSSLA
jgi:hypothetical protein